jgi:chromosome segregation ATPase
VKVLQERGLLDAERLLNTDALELARITGISTNTAFEIKNLLRSDAEQRASQDVARRVAELREINGQLGAECDRLIAANNTLLANNRNLKSQYPVVSEQYGLEMKNFKELQSRVVSARIESNRLSTEINFLREEHLKLLDLVEEKHLLLDDLFRRFNSIRSSFEFVNGETGFAEDMVMNVEGLLNKALMQKRSLNDKIASSEESMEKLFSEFNSIVKKGKMEFYRNI